VDIDRTPIDALVARFADERHCPTIAWGIVRDGYLAASGAYDPDNAVDDRTVYRIASMTKSFSAAATLWLRDQGVLRLDDPVGRYDERLDALRSPTSDAPPITVRDLLAMSSGLVSDDPWADRHLALTDDEFDAIVAGGCVFGEPTGTTYEYSNFGFAVLGRVCEQASGRRIQDVVADELLAPLGMADSAWTAPADRDWMRPLRWFDDHFEEEIATPGDGVLAPMGGIWTTVADLARWIAWLDDAFPARDGLDDGPLSRASRREMQTIQRYVGMRTVRGTSAPSGYGYGLRIVDEQTLGHQVFHSGGFPGYGSSMRWLPGRRLGVVAVSNVTYAPMTELCALLLDALHDQGVVPPQIRPVAPHLERVGRQLLALLNAWDDGVADDLFTDNVACDDCYARRRREADALAPLSLRDISAINDAHGTINASTASGATAAITFAVAPALPIRIQDYEISVSTPSG
jgi:CubicO group peptidase (beta-lactamase class C family)